MANNCLAKKLKATVNNSNLPKMGEMIIRGVKPSSYSSPWKFITIKGIDLYLDIVNVSDGADIQFCTSQGVKSGTHKEGNELTDLHIGTDVAGASCDIIIGNKYSINYWQSSFGGELDCADLSWKNIVYFDDTYSYKINVNMLKLADATFINIDKCADSFDLALLAGSTNLTSLRINGLVHGNISNIAGNTNLATFSVQSKLASITGDISAFQNTKVPSLLLHSATADDGKVSVYGDLSTLPSTCHLITLSANPNMGKFTWGGTKSGYRLGILGASFSSGIDAMLNNQATLDSYTESEAWQNTITVSSDVDPTVAQSVYDTIKTKGINTIKINDTSH